MVGCILGGAMGDALGGPYEGTVPPVVIDDSHAWVLSDDTQLTLATCESIARTGRVDAEDIARRMAEWFSQGRITGVGASTLKALRDLCAGAHWALSGRQGEMAAGNGAAMRISPLAFLLNPFVAADRVMIRDVSRITHRNEEAYVGALAICIAVRLAQQGSWQFTREAIGEVAGELPDSVVKDRLLELDQLPNGAEAHHAAARFGASGYVADSVPLAIFAASASGTSFRDIVIAAVGCGGDTDTIASMAAQISGAAVGVGGLPSEWRNRVPNEEEIIKTSLGIIERR